MLNPNRNTAPDSCLVILHYLTSGVVFLALTLFIFFFPESFTGHYFNPKLLAFTHIGVLGWISMIIFGALYQLLPVIVEKPLYSEKLGWITYALLLPGTLLLTSGFWYFKLNTGLFTGGALVLLAMTTFSFNIFKTIRSGKKRDLIEVEFTGTSLLWLLLTVITGFTLALNLRLAFLPKEHLEYLKLHAHMGAIGWFLMLIIGVTAKLIPMFSLTHQVNKKLLSKTYWLLQSGLVLFIFHRLWSWHELVLWLSWGALITGLGFYLAFIFRVFRKRLRRKLDLAMKFTYITFPLLVLPIATGSFLLIYKDIPGNYSPHFLVYGITLFLGFIGLLILGQTYKTLPFILWLSKLQPFAGKYKISMPQHLFSSGLLKFQFILYLAALTLLIPAIVIDHILMIRLAGSLFVMAAITYNLNMYKILFSAIAEKKKWTYENL